MNIKLEIRLDSYSKYVSNWAAGSVLDPKVSLLKGEGHLQLTLSGQPMRKTVLASEMSLAQANETFYGSGVNGQLPVLYFNSSNGKYLADSISKYLVDTSAFEFNSWGFVLAYRYYNGLAPSYCFDQFGSDIGGYVSTNASAYSGTPPTWNEELKILDYQISAPHYLSTGELNRGYFSLVLDSQIAQCLWGLDPTKAKVSVSILNSDGQAQVATTEIKVTAERIEIRATGFHFSSPTFQLKISNTPTANTPKVKRQITCVKGKIVKKVTAIQPKCPAGYKKK
jgi:hypothetical protein